MKLCLAMATADGGERIFPLSERRTVLGSDTRCDLRVSMPSVMTRHCEIVTENGVTRVLDLGTAGGTLRNGEPVREAVLAPNDTLTVGPVTFVVRLLDDTDARNWRPGATWPEPKPDGNAWRPDSPRGSPGGTVTP